MIPRIIEVTFDRVYPIDEGYLAIGHQPKGEPVALFPVKKPASIHFTMKVKFSLSLVGHLDLGDDTDLTHVYARPDRDDRYCLRLRAYSRHKDPLTPHQAITSFDELVRKAHAIAFSAKDRAFLQVAIDKFFAGSYVHRPYDWLRANVLAATCATIDDWHPSMFTSWGQLRRLDHQQKLDRLRWERILGGELPKEKIEWPPSDDAMMDDDGADTVAYESGSPRF